MAYVNGNWVETTSSGYGIAPPREDQRYTGGVGPFGLVTPGLMNLWNLGRDKGWFSLNPREAIEKKKEEERLQQLKMLQQSQTGVAHGYPQAFKQEEWEQPVPTREPEAQDDDDWFKKMMQLSFMRSMMPEPSEYSGTSTVQVGPAKRDFFDIPYYGSPYPGGTNV
jgi:hypothetical protein